MALLLFTRPFPAWGLCVLDGLFTGQAEHGNLHFEVRHEKEHEPRHLAKRPLEGSEHEY